MKTKEQLILEAKSKGSLASTLRGAINYLLNHRVPVRSLPLNKTEFLQTEADRKSYPEAKRARDDKKYRENYLRRLSREVKQINRQPETLAQISEFVNNQKEANVRLDEIAHIRQIIFNRPIRESMTRTELHTQLVGCAVIPGAIPTQSEIRGKKQFANFSSMLDRGVSWDITAGFISRILRNRYSKSEKRNGSWVTVSHGIHIAEYRRFGLIDKSNSRNLLIADGEREFSVLLPENYHWEIDQNGIKAVWGPDDYHVVMSDLLNVNATDLICNAISENAKTRRLIAIQLAAEKADVEGIWVCLNDSLRGGNCQAGTEKFAEQHTLNVHRHYHAVELLSIHTNDIFRVRLAIQAARIRTQREETQGFALLSEHGFEGISK